MARKTIILDGSKYGRLTIIKEVAAKKRSRYFLCECVCGNKKEIKLFNLTSGKTTSCGCYKPHLTHGYTKTSTYRSWVEMKRRCDGLDKSRSCYKSYCALGITYDKNWSSFKNFYKDMGERPIGKSLDRINTFGNYSKSNCRWATRQEQADNKRKNITRKINGKEYTSHTSLAKSFNINRSTLSQRLGNGWTLQEALTTPVDNSRKKKC